MWLDVSDAEADTRDDLIDGLRAASVRYLGGGPDGTRAQRARALPSADLICGLAHSHDARLRTALTALLVHQPQLAEIAERLAAAALQRTWAFSLDIYQPGWERIGAGALAAALGVPSPDVDYGRATLRALNTLLGGAEPAAPDYLGAWEDVGRHVIADLRGIHRQWRVRRRLAPV